VAIKKTDLYASLWASCDELRGGMDASQYKNYILTLLFVKYVSDKYADKPYGAIRVPQGGSFRDMTDAAGKADVGDRLNKVVGALAKANDMDWLQSTDNDFNNEDRIGKGKAMVDRLSKLVRIFENLDFGKNRADGDDLLGDAYEYLMRHFATESGKSKGQFYTPSEVSIVLSKIIGIGPDTSQDQTAYDPTCGSGSLLLKVNGEASNGLSLFGQEKEQATAALAKMNMVLHDSPTGVIWQDDTISDPHWLNEDGTLKQFDFAVANPPFSVKSWSSGINVDEDRFNRFEYGKPPEKNGDYAFLLHIIKSLKSTGRGAVILPHGVLFRGNAEAGIRRKLVHQGYIKAIIGLPANLFYGTGIPACIVVIDKGAAKANNPVFMIDASKGFIKDGNKNRLRAQDIHRIVDTFKTQAEIERYSRLVPYDEIAEKNGFNLNIPRYIDASPPEDLHDLDAHLNGGIPNRDIDALGEYWEVLPSLRETLFEDGLRAGYSKALVDPRDVKKTILDHAEFQDFKAASLSRFEAWKSAHTERLKSIAVGDDPKALIHEISEDLLARFHGADLLDKYDIYQILMTYWSETMQDDVFMLVQDGWDAARTVRQLVPVKDKNGKNVYKEDADFEFGARANKTKHKSDIIPPGLVVSRFFATENAALDGLTQAHEDAVQALESFIEGQSGEDSLIEAARGEKGGFAQKDVNAELKAATDEDERNALDQLLALIKAEAAAKKAAKAAKDALDKQVFEAIPKLTDADAKTLVVDDKWMRTLGARIVEEIERTAQALAVRVRVLEERYADALPDLEATTFDASAQVRAHLEKMGLTW
jgi:type I restriction enzyme M protein